jgi:hypothetical protein
MSATILTADEAEAIQHACEWADLDMRFRRSYSGRGMYGATCIGVTHTYSTDLARLCEELRDAGQEKLARLLSRGGRSDNMGLRTITYWPSVSVATPDTSGEDDE